MLDDIDYSDLSATTESAPKKKSAISERKLSSKSESKPSPKPVDTGVLADKATALQQGLGAPEIGDPLAQYGLPGLGVLGGLATAYGLYQASKNKPAAPVTPPSVVGGVPSASSIQYTTSGTQPAMQYGQQTLNAPVGVPSPAVTPFTPAQPTIDEQIKMERLKQAQLRTAQLEKASQQKPAGTPVAAAETVANVAPAQAVPPVDRNQRAAELIEANRQAGLGNKPTTSGQTVNRYEQATDLGVNKTAPTPAPVPMTLEEINAAWKKDPASTPSTSAPVVTGEASASVAPKTRAPKRSSEQVALDNSQKGVNMYRNMFGFDQKNPTSPKSLAAIETTDRFISESMQGKIPGSRDLMLNPATDVGASGKKFYSGTPEGYRNAYIPWIEKNLNTLPPETQSHILSSMTKGQTKDLTKIMKNLGIAGTALAAYETAFAKTPRERMEAGTNLIGAVLPPGMDILEAGAPGISQKQFEDAYKLGSPYAQTEEAKKYRLKEKAGAGRGIAPPSAYQR